MPAQPYRRDRRVYARPRGYTGIGPHLFWTFAAVLTIVAVGWSVLALSSQVGISGDRVYSGVVTGVADPISVALPPSELIAEVAVTPGQIVQPGDVLARLDTARLKVAQAGLQTRLKVQEFLLICLERQQSSPPADPLNPALSIAYKQAEQTCAEHHDAARARVAPLELDRSALLAQRDVILRTLKLVLAADRPDQSEQLRKSLILRQELNKVDDALQAMESQLEQRQEAQLDTSGQAFERVQAEIDAIYQEFASLSELLLVPVVRSTRAAVVSTVEPKVVSAGQPPNSITLLPTNGAQFRAVLTVPTAEAVHLSAGQRFPLKTEFAGVPIEKLEAEIVQVESVDDLEPDRNIEVALRLSPETQAFFAKLGDAVSEAPTPIPFTVSLPGQRRSLGHVLRRVFARALA